MGGAQGGESSSSNTAPQPAGSLLYLDYLKREKGVRLLPLFTIVGKTIQMSVVLQHRKWSLPEHAQERGVSTSMGAARAYLAKLVRAPHAMGTMASMHPQPWCLPMGGTAMGMECTVPCVHLTGQHATPTPHGAPPWWAPMHCMLEHVPCPADMRGSAGQCPPGEGPSCPARV